MKRGSIVLGTLIAFAGILTSPAEAQETLIACQERAEIKQVIDSDGALMPDGCREVTVTAVDDESARLCVVDLGEADEGILESLRDAALSSQWWVRCDAINKGAQSQ